MSELFGFIGGVSISFFIVIFFIIMKPVLVIKLVRKSIGSDIKNYSRWMKESREKLKKIDRVMKE